MKNRAKYEKELPHSFEDLIQQDLDYAHQYLLLFLEEIFDNNEIGEITDHIMGKKPLAEKNSKANYLKDRWKSIQSMIEM
ncbi:MAG TPA: hypothetical protein PKC14_04815, partial [Candidatus Absconditabacterales bacterium]|nr:hypothetical protein [Candidatus Absconditabacterales bacterium]